MLGTLAMMQTNLSATHFPAKYPEERVEIYSDTNESNGRHATEGYV
jgi:hypothetical protein